MFNSPNSSAVVAEVPPAQSLPSKLNLATPVVVALACVSAAVGLLSVYSTVTALLNIWRNDDLRSMGMVVPLVSLALILRSWRQIGWRADGSWWGFALLAAAAGLMFLHDQTLLVVMINKDWLLQIPPLPLIAMVYAAAMVLLFGGMPLLRQAWFGILFMGMVIPVPHTFTRAVDLPLQHASATVARAFAHVLGQQLTQDKLRLMFTPDFGMFIAPGCNGIRGAVTLGLAAVVVSYVYRFRWFVYAPIVFGAVFLGYLFNFLRLCLLVVYYKIALPYPWLQVRATGADFLIGGALFICALALFFTVANRLRNEPGDVLPGSADLADRTDGCASQVLPISLAGKVLAVVCLSAIFGADAYATNVADARMRASAPQVKGFPAQLGRYGLLRTWNDTLPNGTIVYSWGEYGLAGDNDSHVAIGISPVLDVHDAEICHLARGEDPVHHAQLSTPSASETVDLTTAAYIDGTVQWIEASTVCDYGACRQYSQSSQHFMVTYAHPHRGVPLAANEERPVPVLFRLETTDTLSANSVIRLKLTARLKDFLQGFDLVQITKPYTSRPSAG